MITIIDRWKQLAARRLSKTFLTRTDVIILLCIVMLLGVMGVAVKLVLQKDTYVTVELLASGGEWWWGVPPPYYWNARDIVIGAKEYDSFRKVTSEVVDLVKYGEDDRRFMWLEVRLLAKKNMLTKTYSFKQETLQIGKTIHLSPNNVAIIGQIVGIEGVGRMWKTEYVEVQGKVRHIEPWEADAIKPADKVFDNKGQLVAEIQEVRVENSDVMTTTWTGDTLVRKNPLLRDVTTKMKLRVMKDDSMRYFNFYQPVEIGNNIRIQFPETAIEFNIMSITPAN